MDDLNEKWKSGKLEEGYYYVKVNKTLSCIEIDYYHILGETKYWNGNDNEDIIEIIDKVPSYKEYQEIRNGNDMFISKIKDAWFFNIDKNDFLQKIHILTESQMNLENTVGELGDENAKLKHLVEDIRKQTKILRKKVTLWKNGLFCTTEKSALFHIEKALQNIEKVTK